MYNFSIFAIDSSPHPILDIKKISFFFVQEIGCPRYQFKFQVEMRKHFQLTSKFWYMSIPELNVCNVHMLQAPLKELS
jgi:hypothetical protein